MTKLGDLIKKKREELGLSQKAFGTLVGAEQRTVSDIERGVTGYMRSSKLAGVLGVTQEELDELVEDALADLGKTKRRPKAIAQRAKPHRPSHIVSIDDAPSRDVHVLGRAAGGEDGEYEFNGDVIGHMAVPFKFIHLPGLYGIYVSGESMMPHYSDGEPILVDPSCTEPERGDAVVVQTRPRREDLPPRGFFKEFWGWTPSHLILRQYNPERMIRVPRQDVESVHVAIWPDV